ncbi:MAG: sulfate ABC transporter substrate-binding protein [Actinobacteria bacterium]|nr:MAG: sulfate ABC transporter substrate-binding protein [Actinomycetota bacterium]
MGIRFSTGARRLLGRPGRTPGARRAVARVGLAALGALAIGVGVAACGSSSSADSSGPVDIVAYSTPETVYKEGLIPAFKKTSQGSGADFSTSFGPSGDQSRAVEAGQPASVVHFSIQPDMQRLVDAGLVDSNWDQNSYNGFVQDSVVVFVVRKGNPKNIQKPGVQVLTPNPFSSGGARWNLMAAYGSQIEEGKSDAQAQEYLKQLLGNVVLQAPAASDSMTAFTQGKGDVALAYENEAIAAQKAGEDVDYVIPKDTIQIQTPIATTTDASTTAQDFVKWLYTPEAQQIWADNGYRPVVKSVLDKNAKEFPTPPGLFTIDKLGGWDQVTTKFFDDSNGIVTKDEQDLGVSTSG